MKDLTTNAMPLQPTPSLERPEAPPPAPPQGGPCTTPPVTPAPATPARDERVPTLRPRPEVASSCVGEIEQNPAATQFPAETARRAIACTGFGGPEDGEPLASPTSSDAATTVPAPAGPSEASPAPARLPETWTWSGENPNQATPAPITQAAP